MTERGVGPGAGRRRRRDPQRRDRIIDACLEVIAEHGIAGTSHRRVAEAAGVPLGSMTYHFTGMDELLREAFASFAGTVAARFEQRLDAADDVGEAVDAVVAMVLQDVFVTSRELVLTQEFYTLAARVPGYRDLTTAWMARSRRALERYFDPLTAALIDAMIEGLTVHRALDRGRRDPDELTEAIARLVGIAHRGDAEGAQVS